MHPFGLREHRLTQPTDTDGLGSNISLAITSGSTVRRCQLIPVDTAALWWTGSLTENGRDLQFESVTLVSERAKGTH